jgi:hypothetical protein
VTRPDFCFENRRSSFCIYEDSYKAAAPEKLQTQNSVKKYQFDVKILTLASQARENGIKKFIATNGIDCESNSSRVFSALPGGLCGELVFLRVPLVVAPYSVVGGVLQVLKSLIPV